MITSAQCKAARALVDLSQRELASAARVGVVTVRQFEAGNVRPRNSTAEVIERALETAGVQFLKADLAGGAGVRIMPFSFRTSRIGPFGRLRETDVIKRFASKEKAMVAARTALLAAQERGKVTFDYEKDFWSLQVPGETSRLRLELIGHFGGAISHLNFELKIEET
jgi:transcriptional regulator with XRE-family HTH domain